MRWGFVLFLLFSSVYSFGNSHAQVESVQDLCSRVLVGVRALAPKGSAHISPDALETVEGIIRRLQTASGSDTTVVLKQMVLPGGKLQLFSTDPNVYLPSLHRARGEDVSIKNLVEDMERSLARWKTSTSEDEFAYTFDHTKLMPAMTLPRGSGWIGRTFNKIFAAGMVLPFSFLASQVGDALHNAGYTLPSNETFAEMSIYRGFALAAGFLCYRGMDRLRASPWGRRFIGAFLGVMGTLTGAAYFNDWQSLSEFERIYSTTGTNVAAIFGSIIGAFTAQEVVATITRSEFMANLIYLNRSDLSFASETVDMFPRLRTAIADPRGQYHVLVLRPDGGPARYLVEKVDLGGVTSFHTLQGTATFTP